MMRGTTVASTFLTLWRSSERRSGERTNASVCTKSPCCSAVVPPISSASLH